MAEDGSLPTENDTTGVYGVMPSAFRISPALRLGPVRLQVQNLPRSLAYYQQVVGLRVVEMDEREASLSAVGDPSPLLELLTSPAVRPSGGARLGLYHVALLLPERAQLGRFARHLAGTGTRMAASDHLVSEALYLRDPDGHGIEVYADRPRESWRVVDRELQMATAPLDLVELARAGQHGEWAGMPAKTVIGHLHLHVGDLAMAEAFYHRGLGLDKIVWSYPGALFLSAGGYHHHLGVNTWAGSSATPPATHEAQLVEWEIVLPTAAEAEAVAGNLDREGWGPEPLTGGFRVQDPWGTALRIVVGAGDPAGGEIAGE